MLTKNGIVNCVKFVAQNKFLRFMKKIAFIVTILSLFSLKTTAQITAGRIYLGGGLGFSSGSGKTTVKTSNSTTEIKDPIRTTFEIAPGAGYILSDKFGVGLNFGFNSSTSKEDSTNYSDKSTSSSFFVNPYFRYYMMLEDNFGFTGTLNIRLGSGRSKSETTIANITTTVEGPKLSSMSIGITPGIIYFPTNKIGLEANIGFLGFASSTSKQETVFGNSVVTTTSTNSSFGLNVDTFTPAFNVGFFYYIGE